MLFTIKNQYHLKRTISLAYPIMISQASHILIGLSDTYLAGHLGSDELAGVALGSAVFSIILVAALGITLALTPLIAKADGENNPDKVAAYFRNAALLFPVLGVLFLIIGYTVTLNLDVMGQKPEVVAQASSFLGPFIFSLLCIMIYQVFKQFIEGLGHTKPAMIINLVSVGVNIILAFTFTRGWLGLPKMGVFGIGLAGLIDRFFMALIMMLYVLNNKQFKHYVTLAKAQIMQKSIMVDILKMGVPISMQFLLEVACFGGAGILAGHFGINAQAAHQIALQMAATTFMAASGIATASSIRVGNYLGQRNYVELRRAGMVAISMSAAFMTLTGLLFITCKSWLPTLFSADVAVTDIASTLLIFAAIFQISDGIQATCQGALRGLGDVQYPTLICAVSYWVFGLPFGYLLASYFGYGVYGIWIGLCTGLGIASVLLLLRFFVASQPAAISKRNIDPNLVLAH